jgi:adenylyl- and sulfurtransferase ThiI
MSGGVDSSVAAWLTLQQGFSCKGMTLQLHDFGCGGSRDALDARQERLMKILDRECDGQTTNLGVATLSYRKTSRLEVTDEAKAVAWLKRHKFKDAFKVPAPTVYKTEVRRLLNAGQKIPGCVVVDDRSYSLK